MDSQFMDLSDNSSYVINCEHTNLYVVTNFVFVSLCLDVFINMGQDTNFYTHVISDKP